MIRFLDLKNQITEGDCDFSFYDTVTTKIISFDNEQVFESIDDLKEAYFICAKKDKPDLERILSLIPDNYFNNKTKRA